jgi:hypothetical protein
MLKTENFLWKEKKVLVALFGMICGKNDNFCRIEYKTLCNRKLGRRCDKLARLPLSDALPLVGQAQEHRIDLHYHLQMSD